MKKTSAIKEIYIEIRRALGAEISEAEVLELAHLLLNTAKKQNEPRFDLRTGGVGFDQQGIDKVFSDGGWKVLHRECEQYRMIKQKEREERILHNRIARWLISK